MAQGSEDGCGKAQERPTKGSESSEVRKCRHEAESAIQSATFTSRDSLGGVTDKSETFADSVTL